MERRGKMSTTKIQENIQQNKELVDFFDKQLDRTNYWLSFAEAKNGALLAINVAIMAVLASVFDNAPVICTIALICFIISCGACLLSFFPNVKSRPTNQNYKKKEDINPNLLFFGDIAKMLSTEKYIELSLSMYFAGKETVQYDKETYDLASEVLMNSRIAVQKYNVFKCAAKIDFVALIVMVLFFVVA